MTELRCETCCQGGARHYEGKGWFCRQCRPMPDARELVVACRWALTEGRLDDLSRLLRLLSVSLVGLRRHRRRPR